jgi:PAS domain S-box-containing protein
MSERREMSEEALRESEERLRFALEAARFGMWEHDLRTDSLLISERCKEIFGRPADADLTHEEILAMVHVDDLAEVQGAIHAAIRDRRGYDLEYRIHLPEGNVRWVMVRGRATYDGDGKAVHTLGLVMDITERKEAETLLSEQAEQLRQLSDSLQEATRRKDEFLAMLAHELRNPLAPVVNALQILQQSRDDGQTERAREIISRQVGTMRRLVDDLLDVSRITTGKIILKRERLDLVAATERAVDHARPFIAECGHALEVELPAEPIFVDADPVRIEQVISNLLNNAAKYTERGGRIRVRVDASGTETRLAVEDNGIGIPAGLIEEVFDLFTQGERGLDRSYGGLGLGLTLVRNLTEMHGGRVNAASEGPGKGSRFEVTLPFAAPSNATSSASNESCPTADSQSWPAARGTILVVDDNRDGAETLGELLELWGYPVTIAHDGPTAMEQVRLLTPSLVLLDIGMPGMNGYEVARTLRSEGLKAGTVLVAITGYGRREDVERAREAGFDHHLTKPVDLSELQALLQSV